MQVDARTHAQTHSTCAQVSRDGFNTRASSAVSPDSWTVSHTDRPSSSVGSHTACAKLTHHTLLSTCTRGLTGTAHREPGYNVYCNNEPPSTALSLLPLCDRPLAMAASRSPPCASAANLLYLPQLGGFEHVGLVGEIRGVHGSE